MEYCCTHTCCTSYTLINQLYRCASVEFRVRTLLCTAVQLTAPPSPPDIYNAADPTLLARMHVRLFLGIRNIATQTTTRAGAFCKGCKSHSAGCQENERESQHLQPVVETHKYKIHCCRNKHERHQVPRRGRVIAVTCRMCSFVRILLYGVHKSHRILLYTAIIHSASYLCHNLCASGHLGARLVHRGRRPQAHR